MEQLVKSIFGWDGAAGAFSMIDLKNKISLTYFQHIRNRNLDIQDKIKNALYLDLMAIESGKDENEVERRNL